MKTLPSFEKYKIDLYHFCLKSGDDEIFMEPRLIRLLEVLTRNANQVVRKNDIMESVWQSVIVNEESLPRAILDLRRALKLRFSNPPEIQTIRNVGYRLMVSEPAEQNRTKRFAQRFAKIAIIIIGVFLFIVMIIRAVNY